MLTGRCHCGAISYIAEGPPEHHALCHCGDCRRSAGAPMVGWIAFKTEQVTILGDPVTYESSTSGRRQFCGRCGTGLFYTNAAYLPGIIDVQSCTLDESNAVAPARISRWPSGWLGWRTWRRCLRSSDIRGCDQKLLLKFQRVVGPSPNRLASVTNRA